MQVQRVDFLPLFNLRAMPFEFSTVEWSAVRKNKSSTVQNSTEGQSVIHQYTIALESLSVRWRRKRSGNNQRDCRNYSLPPDTIDC